MYIIYVCMLIGVYVSAYGHASVPTYIYTYVRTDAYKFLFVGI